MEDRQKTVQKGTKNSTGSTMKTIVGLVVICIILYNVIPMFFPVGGNSKAQKEAELYIKNSIYDVVGNIPAVDSKVVYKNKDYILVGVRYAFDKSELKNSDFARIVCCFKRGGDVYMSTGDLSSKDVFKLSKDELEQMKVFFQIH